MKLWSWIRRDGLLHIETCTLIVILFSIFLPWWAGGLISLASGICKELWDLKHGVANWHDIICDIIGVILGIVIVIL